VIPATSASEGIKVHARDRYGNDVTDGVIVTMGYSTTATGSVTALTSKTTVSGVADFADGILIDTLGTTDYLRAGVSGAQDGTPAASSSPFQVAVDVKACNGNATGSICTNTGKTNADQQRVYNQIVATTTGGFFSADRNVLLRTQFYTPSTFGAPTSACGTLTGLAGQGEEALPQGTGTVASKPTTKMLIVISAAFLKANGISARSASSFNACVGAKWIDTTTPKAWTAKPVKGGGTVPAVPGTDGLYWGYARPCGSLAKGSMDPCIDLATKNAADVQKYFNLSAKETANLITNGDVGIVVRTIFPWDSKGMLN
jgi:hypothetical protein